jgi:hypothetical protein
MASPTYKGRSQAIHVGGSGAALVATGPHGWRLSVPGTQVIGAGTSATVIFDAVVQDTNHYWDAVAATKVRVPAGLGGTYVFGADGFIPAYNPVGLLFEVIIESGDAEDVPALHTHPPVGLTPMGSFNKLAALAILHLKVTNLTGSSITLTEGSFTGVLLLPEPTKKKSFTITKLYSLHNHTLELGITAPEPWSHRFDPEFSTANEVIDTIGPYFPTDLVWYLKDINCDFTWQWDSTFNVLVENGPLPAGPELWKPALYDGSYRIYWLDGDITCTYNRGPASNGGDNFTVQIDVN